RPGNCSGMEEATGAPSSFAVWDPKRLRASGRDGETVMTEPPSPLRMLLSRHTKRREFITLLGGAALALPLGPCSELKRQCRGVAPITVRALKSFAQDRTKVAKADKHGPLAWIIIRRNNDTSDPGLRACDRRI